MAIAAGSVRAFSYGVDEGAARPRVLVYVAGVSRVGWEDVMGVVMARWRRGMGTVFFLPVLT